MWNTALKSAPDTAPLIAGCCPASARSLRRSTPTGSLFSFTARSRRQAYRYLEEAEAIGHPVPVREASVPITFKIPGSVVRGLRSYSADSGLTLGEIVARAISTFLKATRRHG
jgi:hypothetical protein